MRNQGRMIKIILLTLIVIGTVFSPASRTVTAEEKENTISEVTIDVTPPRVGDSTMAAKISVPFEADYSWIESPGGDEWYKEDTSGLIGEDSFHRTCHSCIYCSFGRRCSLCSEQR